MTIEVGSQDSSAVQSAGVVVVFVGVFDEVSVVLSDPLSDPLVDGIFGSDNAPPVEELIGLRGSLIGSAASSHPNDRINIKVGIIFFKVW